MEKRNSLIIGAVLVLLGLVSLGATTILPTLGIHVLRWSLLRLWPLIVTGVGWCFILPPLLNRRRRGLGGLYIPGIPILTTGAILLFCSLVDWWGAWSWLWPLEVLGVAAGFIAAAIHMQVIWLLIPATIIGANGVLFQFCAITGMWDVWAVMWTIEPLSVGVALLGIGARKHIGGLMLAGLILCAISGVGLIGMVAIVSMSAMWASWWLFKLVGPGLLILTGVMFLMWSLFRQIAAPKYPLR